MTEQAMTHEKNMMDYLDWIEGVFLDNQTSRNKIFTHRDFLKSQPKLGDFVPTNEEGEVMERPFDFGNWEKAHYPSLKRMRVHEDYQSALDRRLWVGWRVKYNGNIDTGLIHRDGERLWMSTYKTYELLITSGVKLERIQRK